MTMTIEHIMNDMNPIKTKQEKSNRSHGPWINLSLTKVINANI